MHVHAAHMMHPNSGVSMQNPNTMHFQELVAAASKFEFSQDGIHAVTRDYMHTTLWDMRKNSQPVKNFQVQPSQSCGLVYPCFV